MPTDDRPNIVLIQTDQLTPFVLGAYGDANARTPNIDALARSGVCFDGAYCNSPLCTPSRMSMLTGRYVQRLGTWDNGASLSSDVPTMLHTFSAAGYRTVLSGKMHFIGPDQLHGYEERLTTDIYPAYPKWTYDWDEEQRHGARHAPPGHDTWLWCHEYDQRTVERALDWLRLNACDGLKGYRRKSNRPDKPFFLTVSMTNPHPPYCTPDAYWDRFEDVDLPLPTWPEGHIEQEHVEVRWNRDYHGLHELPTDDEVRAARRAYYGNVAFVDDKVGEIMHWIDELGLRENTIVVFCSDHGEMLGEHGCWCKRVAYEWSTRVPLIMSAPGRLPEGERVGEVTQLVDLMPTLHELCGLEPPQRVDGCSNVPLIEGRAVDWPNEALCENYTEGLKAACCMLRRDHLKYVGVAGHEPALYDLNADPGEFTNVAGDPACAEQEAAMKARLAELWDAEGTDRAVRESTADRLIVKEAMEKGAHRPWDYDPAPDLRERWNR